MKSYKRNWLKVGLDFCHEMDELATETLLAQLKVVLTDIDEIPPKDEGEEMRLVMFGLLMGYLYDEGEVQTLLRKAG